MMVQRWRISSNSQLPCVHGYAIQRCLWWFKDEEFQAIHNVSSLIRIRPVGVYDGSKMKNFKQFTTTASTVRRGNQGVYDGSKMKNFKQFTTWHWHLESGCTVSMMVQRWRISSNSQRLMSNSSFRYGCLWWFKDEEFQAYNSQNVKEQ